MKGKTLLISLLAVSAVSYAAFSYLASNKNTGVSSAQENKKIKVLIVPGHEPKDGGTDYKGLWERDLNVQLSDMLASDLSENEKMEVIVARDKNGWNTEIKNYVEGNKEAIMNWVSDKKDEMMKLVDEGMMKLINPGMKHNAADESAVLYLYGMNKWANENNIDLVLHVHFNNNPKYKDKPNYRGFAIYIPEKQYDNSSSSKILADYLFQEISKIEKPSNMPQEKGTILESQELIAIGRYNTLESAVATIEYAYIYETAMKTASRRDAFIKKAASSTVEAINDFLEPKISSDF